MMDNVDTICIETLEINTREVYLTASEIILKLLGNILNNPADEKYRRIRVSNPTIKSKLFNAIGGKQCLIKIGFVEENDFLILPQYISINSIRQYREHLQIRRALVISQNVDTEEKDMELSGVTMQQPKPEFSSNISNNNKGKESSSSKSQDLTVKPKPKIFHGRSIPDKILQTTNKFLQSIEEHSISVLSYEDPALLQQSLSHIPIVQLQLKATERMREIQRAIKSGSCTDKEPLIDDLVLLELLAWFKESFFTWVDVPPCDECGNMDTKFIGSHASSGEKVEMYRCELCRSNTAFPRHCDPAILLSTRRGRCGEWANCFTLLCRAVGWPARHVVDNSDHVWTEVYSEGQNRWLHCDPCENACDSPLMYEQGWGKQPSYIIAYGCDDIQDVTWRYTADHKNAMKRRTLCSEDELLSTIIILRNERRKNLSKKRQEYLARRTLIELVELMTPRKPGESDKLGRTSGSLSWRLARGETTKEVKQHIWIIDEYCKNNTFILRYSTVRDVYECMDDKGIILNSTKGWNCGLYDFDQIFRMEEKDWKMVYLARQKTAAVGKLVWRFHIKHKNVVIDEIKIRLETDVFQNGSASCTMCSGDLCMSIKNGNKEQCITAFQNQKCFDINVNLTGGNGSVAWQHAQVFRQKMDSTSTPFEVKVTLRKL